MRLQKTSPSMASRYSQGKVGSLGPRARVLPRVMS